MTKRSRGQSLLHSLGFISLILVSSAWAAVGEGSRDYSCSGGQCLFGTTDRNGNLKQEVLNCTGSATCKIDEKCGCSCVQAGGSFVAQNVCSKKSTDEIAACEGKKS